MGSLGCLELLLLWLVGKLVICVITIIISSSPSKAILRILRNNTYEWLVLCRYSVNVVYPRIPICVGQPIKLVPFLDHPHAPFPSGRGEREKQNHTDKSQAASSSSCPPPLVLHLLQKPCGICEASGASSWPFGSSGTYRSRGEWGVASQTAVCFARKQVLSPFGAELVCQMTLSSLQKWLDFSVWCSGFYIYTDVAAHH